MIKINNKDVGFIYKNNQNIDKVYKNEQLIFEQGFGREDSGSTPLTTSHEAIGKDLKDYKIYGNSRQSNLPDGYQEVEYIESTGTQYIDIPFDNTNASTNKYYYKYMHRNPISKSSTLLGITSGTNRMGMLWFRTDNTTRMSIGSVTSGSSVFKVNTILQQQLEVTVEVDNTNNKYSVNYNGSEYNDISFSGTSKTSSELKIFNSGSGTSQASNIVLYNLKIWNDNTLIRDFIPCYRKTDNVIGVYDLVTSIFYEATGTLTVGNDVVPSSNYPIPIESVGDNILPSEYQEVEYIIGDNSGYIATDLYLTGSDTVKLKIDTTDFDTSCSIFGAYAGSSAGPNYSIYFSKSASAYVRYGSNTSRGFRAYADNVYDIEMTPTGFKANGESKDTWEAQTFTTSGVMYIGSMTGSSSTSFQGKIYSCEIVGRAKFIPCYKKSDNTVGMYDIIGKKFYSSTGTLTVGNDVNTYEIPITVSDGTNTTTTNIYLNEPLRKVGNYADYINYKTQKVYRNVIVNDDSGEDTIANSYSGTTDNTGTSITLPSISSINGTTIYDADTKVKPSNMYVKYKGK